MRTSVLEAPGRIRTVSGIINADGTINAGSGFTCLKPSTGIYQLKFIPAFANVTKVTITISALFAAGYTVTVAGLGVPPDGPIQFQTYTNAVGSADCPFGFIISGLARAIL